MENPTMELGATLKQTVQDTSHTAVVADAPATTVVRRAVVLPVISGSQPALAHSSIDRVNN